MSAPSLPKEMYWPCPQCRRIDGHHRGCNVPILGYVRTTLETVRQLQEQAFAAGVEVGKSVIAARKDEE